MTQRIEFFHFEQSDIDGTWSTIDRVSSADLTTSYDGNSYLSLAVGRGEIERSQSPEREEVGIVIPATHPLAGLWVPNAPEFPVRVTAYRSEDYAIGASSVTVSSAVKIIDRGQISGASHQGSRCEFTVRNPQARLVQTGPKQRYQRQCRHDLYGPGCTLDRSTFVEPGFASVTTDPAPQNYQDYVFSSAFESLGDNYLGGGTLEVNYNGKWYARQIAVHLDTAVATEPQEAYVRLISPFPFDITNGMALKAYPGCRHTTDDCINKFSNIENFGGFTRVARKNPFTEELD